MSRAAATTASSPRSSSCCPRPGIKPEDLVFVSGIGCAARLPYYMNTYGIHCDPRPRAGGRDRCRAGPSRPARVGDRRRRRHAVDRRQPPDPRAAPQREHQDPDVQQPDLRPHQGPVLADERDGQGHEAHAVRFARPAVQPDLGRARRGGDVRRPHPRHGPQAHDRDVPAGQRAPRARRSSRCTRTATSSTTARSTRSSTRTRGPTCSSTCKHGEPIRFGADRELGVTMNEFGEAKIVRVADVGEDRILVHDETPPRPVARVRACRGWPTTRRRRRPSACSAPSTGRRTRSRCSVSWSTRRPSGGPGDLDGLLRSAPTWSVS